MDDKSIVAQFPQPQKKNHEIIFEGMSLDEQFEVAIMIDKLPPNWKEFKNTLWHKTKEFCLECLITKFWIEEEQSKLDLKDEVLVVTNRNQTRSLTAAALKPN